MKKVSAGRSKKTSKEARRRIKEASIKETSIKLTEKLLHSIIRSGMLDRASVNGAVERQTVKGAVQLAFSLAEQFESECKNRTRPTFNEHLG